MGRFFSIDFGLSFTQTIHEKPTPSMHPENVQLPCGYTVVTTGAGTGIGAQSARAYVQARATDIIVMSRTPSDLEKLKAELDGPTTKNPDLHVRAFPGDASKSETYIRPKSTMQEEFNGRLDCLVNNAGSIGGLEGFTGKLHQLDPNEHANLIDLNYLDPRYAIHQLLPLLLGPRNSRRQIINITSIGVLCHSGYYCIRNKQASPQPLYSTCG
ncbi:hypothetical protein ABOM_002119 [Aspergillus bombycis]|uniref:Short-chain dehydrogenase n=1 Tax=Aspergillus bombycis TaxID=109264 RepID=A0A1F8AAA1_9EURO|nr:hypothetical protein ABOM_002119 [Aspergillus bombycis]OGM48258.1 hypothetical protein ABOM_002119 [Aspergillus bombycis]